MAGDFNIGAGITLDGEAEFKKAVSSINKELTVLGSEMKKVTAQFSDNADSIEALTSKQDVLNKKAEEQRRKIEMLTAALEQAKQEYGENSDKVRDWQIKLNNAEADLAKTESQVRQTANQIENFGKETDKAGKEMDNASKKALTFGDILKANLGAQAIVEGVRALGNSIAGLATGALESADSIQQLSDQTGIAAEKIQELSYIGDALGVSTDTITGSFSKLINNMSSASGGSGTAFEAFKKLNVGVTDANGNLRDSQIVWQEVIGALGKVSSETERTAIAQDIFGKSAASLNPIIGASADDLAELSEQAYATGAIMSGETVANLDNFGDSMAQLKAAAQGMAGALLGQLAPSLDPVIEKLKTVDITPLSNGLKFVIDNASTIAAGLAAIAAGFATMNVISMITGMVTALKSFKDALIEAKVTQEGLNLAMKANVIGIVVTAVAALVTGLVVLWKTNDGFRNAIIGAWNAIKAKTGEVVTAIKGFFSGLVGWFQTLPAKMLSIGKNVVEGIWSGISNAKNWLVVKIKEWCGSVLNGIKSFFGIHSPSRVMRDEVGIMLARGVAEGIQNGIAHARQASKKLGDAIVNELADLNGKLAKAETDTAKNALKDKIAALEEFKREYESAMTEIENKQKSMSDKLSDYGDLFGTATTKLGREYLKLGDLQKDIDKINEYGIALDKLKERGTPDSLMSEVTSMNIDDALNYTKLLLDQTPEQFDEYMRLWNEKQNDAADIAKRFYQDEFKQLQTEFVDKIPAGLDKLKTDMQDIGKISAIGLADGFAEKKTYIISTFKNVLEGAINEIKKAQPTKLETNTEATISTRINQTLATGMSAIAASVPASNNNRPVVIEMDGKAVAKLLYDHIKNENKVRGTALIAGI